MTWLPLCCLVGCVAPLWVLGQEEDASLSDEEGLPYAQGPAESLEQRVALWLLSLVGFYGLVRLLDDVTSEKRNPEGQKETEVVDHDARPGRTPYIHCHGCAMKCTLKSLGRMEQDMVTLLYKLHKHKTALATGWVAEDGVGRAAEGGLPNDLVIYTIQDES